MQEALVPRQAGDGEVGAHLAVEGRQQGQRGDQAATEVRHPVRQRPEVTQVRGPIRARPSQRVKRGEHPPTPGRGRRPAGGHQEEPGARAGSVEGVDPVSADGQGAVEADALGDVVDPFDRGPLELDEPLLGHHVALGPALFELQDDLHHAGGHGQGPPQHDRGPVADPADRRGLHQGRPAALVVGPDRVGHRLLVVGGEAHGGDHGLQRRGGRLVGDAPQIHVARGDPHPAGQLEEPPGPAAAHC